MEDDGTTHPSKTVVSPMARGARGGGSLGGTPGQAFLITIYGEGLGRRFALGATSCVIGRSSKCDIQVDEESVSRNHARIEPVAAGYEIRDGGSTNGTFVNDQMVSVATLRDGDQVKVGHAIFKFIVSGNTEAQYHEEIYRLMTVDGLTELHNKRFFTEAIDKEISRARRYGRSFGIVVFDIDHFKRINDTYGHLAGDSVLRQLGALVRGRVRRDDVPARIGGEEFAVILPEINREGALAFAEKLRVAVAETPFRFEATTIPVTISIGVAEWAAAMEDPTTVVKIADEKLYEAKRGGRNRVCG